MPPAFAADHDKSETKQSEAKAAPAPQEKSVVTAHSVTINGRSYAYKATAGTLSYGLRKRVELARAVALKPDLILLDAGVEVDSLYTADITRTLPVDGTFTDAQREIYDAVYAAQQAGMEAIRPGAKRDGVVLRIPGPTQPCVRPTPKA